MGKLNANLKATERLIPNCDACARLRQYCSGVAKTKKREFAEQSYWGKPVPGFGDPQAAIWIVGLAPAAHGANRTGRMFTGDSSGNWLYRALYRRGWANQPHSSHQKDGLRLSQVYVSAAARCAPPNNRPSPAELARCREFLEQEWSVLRRTVRVVIPLGAIAFAAVRHLMEKAETTRIPRSQRFAHLSEFEWGPVTVISSYHPSRQNTQTGVLSEAAFDAVFLAAERQLSCPTRQKC